MFRRDELEAIAKLAIQYDAFVVTDEVYEHIIYAPAEHICMASLPGMFEHTITCNSLSKTYSITGWRLGYLIGPAEVIEGARKVHDFLTVGACFGIGECALFKGLGTDDRPDYEAMLQTVCRGIDRIDEIDLSTWSSIRFGVETALLDLQHGGRRMIYPSEFTAGKQAIEINGLIWMGDKRTMASRIDEKLAAGFSCIKLKIGAIDFDDECELLAAIRRRYSREDIELRVDANGAFSPYDALEHLQRLSAYDLHSIEQPIRAGQWEAMARLCEETPLPIALDEELIGITDSTEKLALLETISPQYIVLKPSLIGGFSGAEEWIEFARNCRVDWWITSALESNVGLNAIAQWTATLPINMPQGLGTGALYTNNIPSPLEQIGDELRYNPDKTWIFSMDSWK